MKEDCFDIELLSAREIINLGIEGKRHEKIDTNSLVIDERLVDESHRKELVESMRGKRGQISPVTVRARLEGKNKIVYDIIDGFHRGSGFKEAGIEIIDAIVLYGCSDEEMYDLRVLAANSVRSVKFARIANWMQGSFKRSEWSKRGMSLSQILSLAVQDSSGVKLKLSNKEAASAKEWAIEKAKKWGKTVGSIFFDVYIIENADPDLISRVRSTGGGSRGKGVLSPARLRSIVQIFPKNYKEQNFLTELIISHNLNAQEISKIALSLKEDQGRNIIDRKLLEKDPKSFLYFNEDNSQKSTELPDFEDDYFDEEEESDEIIVRPKKINKSSNIDNKELKVVYKQNKDESNIGYENKEVLNKKLTGLSEQVEIFQEILREKNGDNKSQENWYLLISGLTANERSFLKGVFRDNKDPDEILSQLNLTSNQVSQLFLSILKKRYITNTEEKIFRIMKMDNVKK